MGVVGDDPAAKSALLLSVYDHQPLFWATGEPGRGLTWTQLEKVAASELLTIANHTHTHALPEQLSAAELDRCSELIEQRLGVVPNHFAYTWRRPVPEAFPMLRERFRSAATGALGRNLPGADPMLLDRVPVRASDPLPFFAAKLTGGLGPERTYGRIVAAAHLLDKLRGRAPSPLPTSPGGEPRRAVLPFFEAYFSNVIEGTESEIDEAASIVFEGQIPDARPADAHGILGTYRLVADLTEMSTVPADGEHLLDLLRSRHAAIMEGRPDKNPGRFKTATNRVTSRAFVAPDAVIGTL